MYVDGELMKKQESMLLGQILQKADINLSAYGIEVEKLAEGKKEVSYEEMQYILQENPATHILSVNLKEELSSSKSFYRTYNFMYFFTLPCRIRGRKSLQRSSGKRS